MRLPIQFRSSLAAGIILVAASASVADPRHAPRGYWVQSHGFYDRFPYPPEVGSRFEYSHGRPVVTFYGPRGELVSAPLRPKVLYYSTPFVTPDGTYYPTSIIVAPTNRGPRVSPLPPPPTTFRYDGGPADPVPPVAPVGR